MADGAGRAACVDATEAFVEDVGSLSERELLGASRCHGWTRLDVVVHVIAGWYEMLTGLVSTCEEEPTVDAATYWPAFSEGESDDVVATLMSQRRRSSTYARPAAAVEELRVVAGAVVRGVQVCPPGRRRWQGHVFELGDFLATWAVEVVVHQLDLRTGASLPASALSLTRGTIESLAGARAPDSWSDVDLVLAGTGRAPAPSDAGAFGDRLPVLG